MSDEDFAAQHYRRPAVTASPDSVPHRHRRTLNIDDISDEDIARVIEEYDPRLSVAQAYLNQIKERLVVGRDWRFSDPKTIYPYIKAANLPQKPEFEQALAAAWARSSFFRCAAYDQLVWEQFLTEGHLDIASANTYATIILDLGRKQGWTLNVKASEVTERARLVASITQGRDTFQVYGGRQGEAKRLMTLPASSLNDPNLSLEKLREFDAAAADVRRKQGLTPDENRAELQQRATDARGHEVFRPGVHKTELDGQVAFVDDGKGHNKFQFVDFGSKSKPTAGVAMDRTVRVPENAHAIFINPATGQFYSRAELYQLSDTNRALFKTLMRTDNNFLTQLLNAGN